MTLCDQGKDLGVTWAANRVKSILELTYNEEKYEVGAVNERCDSDGYLYAEYFTIDQLKGMTLKQLETMPAGMFAEFIKECNTQ